MKEKTLQTLDEIDRQIIELLHQRAALSIALGASGSETLGSAENAPQGIRDALRGVSSAPGAFPQEALKIVFSEISRACEQLMFPVSVVYLGPDGTFSHAACLQKFGSAAKCVPVGALREVFEEVERGRATYGMVPVENSTEGAVNAALDLFIDCNLQVCGEVLMRIEHHLLSQSEDVSRIARIYSHPQALAQCRRWLERMPPSVSVVEVASTSVAAQRASQEPTAAAIASERAAHIYGLRVVCRRIEDSSNNYTRFLVVGGTPSAPTGADKTTIVFSVRHEVGSLAGVLNEFARGGINLTKIESRPSRQKAWEYVFIVDLLGHQDDENLRRAIEAVRARCLFLKVLGSYPRSEAV